MPTMLDSVPVYKVRSKESVSDSAQANGVRLIKSLSNQVPQHSSRGNPDPECGRLQTGYIFLFQSSGSFEQHFGETRAHLLRL